MASRQITIVRTLLWAAVAFLASILVILNWTNKIQDNIGPRFPLNGPFSMETQKGETFNSATLAGSPYVAFFGFTHCPDVCPTTLFELTAMMKELGPQAEKIKVLLISVDPERDTKELLAQYMTAFDLRFIALRGTQAQTSKVVKSFAAYVKKIETGDGQYTFEHTAGVYVVNAAGRLVKLMRMDEPLEDRMRILRGLLS